MSELGKSKRTSPLSSQINSKCPLGVEGVTGMAAAKRMCVYLCVCVCLRSLNSKNLFLRIKPYIYCCMYWNDGNKRHGCARASANAATPYYMFKRERKRYVAYIRSNA